MEMRIPFSVNFFSAKKFQPWIGFLFVSINKSNRGSACRAKRSSGAVLFAGRSRFTERQDLPRG
jgi:hypothetical protein